jgi:hypothetical protein
MRLLIVAVTSVSALAFASGAFAQAAPQSSQAPPPGGGTGGGLETEQRGHPNWFTEPNTYKPCPASVVLADGRQFALAALRYAARTSKIRRIIYEVRRLVASFRQAIFSNAFLNAFWNAFSKSFTSSEAPYLLCHRDKAVMALRVREFGLG